MRPPETDVSYSSSSDQVVTQAGPTLFLGAGASSYLGFPVCGDFFKSKELQDIVRLPAYKEIAHSLSHEGENVDLEEFLAVTATLSGIEQGRMTPAPASSYIAKILDLASLKAREGRPEVMSKRRDDYPPYVPDAEEISDLDLATKAAIIEIFGRDITSEVARPTRVVLDAMLGARSSLPLSVFTTNYDTVIENALEPLREAEGTQSVNDGFQLKRGMVVWSSDSHGDAGTYSDDERRKTVVEFYKLHGSANWGYRSDGSVVRESGSLKANLAKHAVIYPGFKGIPDIPVLRHAHIAFRRALATSNRLVVFGYSFRDAYLNSIMSDALQENRRLRVVVVDIRPGPVVERLSAVGVKSDRIVPITGNLEGVDTASVLMSAVEQA